VGWFPVSTWTLPVLTACGLLILSSSDIIDTEPADGDVRKMLLGSFVEEFDEEDHEDPTSTPPSVGFLGLTDSPEDLRYSSAATTPTRSPSYRLSAGPSSTGHSPRASPSQTESPFELILSRATGSHTTARESMPSNHSNERSRYMPGD